MTIYDLKPAFQNLLRPTCKHLATAGITPNQVTVLALILSLITGSFILAFDAARWTLALVPAVLLVRMALNAMDGMLAREHDLASNLGAVLNELGDVVSDTAIYLPFAILPGMSWLVVIAVILAIMTELTGLVAVQIGAARRYDGPMGKSDRAFVFGCVGLFMACGLDPGAWLQVLMGFVSVLLIITILNRARRALVEARP